MNVKSFTSHRYLLDIEHRWRESCFQIFFVKMTKNIRLILNVLYTIYSNLKKLWFFTFTIYYSLGLIVDHRTRLHEYIIIMTYVLLFLTLFFLLVHYKILYNTLWLQLVWILKSEKVSVTSYSFYIQTSKFDSYVIHCYVYSTFMLYCFNK